MNPQLHKEIQALLIINGIEPNTKPMLEKNIGTLVEKYTNPDKSVSLLLPDLLRSKDAKPCPLCTQTVKVYYRSITPAMAYCLIRVFRIQPNDYVDIPSLFKEKHAVQSDFTKLKFWGLIEQGKEVAAGMWKLTHKGRDFVQNKTSVQKYAKVFNDTFKGFDGETEEIIMCLDAKYNYTHLMTAPVSEI